jgi:hypothetical protein
VVNYRERHTIAVGFVMNEHWWAECQNHACRHRIALPTPNRPAILDNPLQWPRDDYRVTLLCPICDEAYEYRADNFHSDLFPTLDPYKRGELWLVEISFVCAEQNCESRVTLHRSADAHATREVVLNGTHNWHFRFFCPTGHAPRIPEHDDIDVNFAERGRLPD